MAVSDCKGSLPWIPMTVSDGMGSFILLISDDSFPINEKQCIRCSVK